MKLTPYKQILKLGKEKVAELLAPVRANEMRKKAELEIAQIEGKLLEKEQAVHELCSAYPIDFSKLIDAMDEVALLERRKKQLAGIAAELFP